MLKRFILILVILALIITGLYFGIRSLVNTKRQNEQVSQTISEQLASTSPNSDGDTNQNDLINNLPTSTTTVPTSWTSHNIAQFSISYSPDLVVSNSSDASSTIIVLAFPKDNYFHWPLQDDARITITASSSCVETTVPQNPSTATTTFSLNGYSFIATQGNDVAAGNLYHEILYTTEANGQCYSFSFFDHGSNGAGLYVDDPVLIRKYDSQHSNDYSQAIGAFDSIVTSFKTVL